MNTPIKKIPGTFAISVLARYPEIQNKIREEIKLIAELNGTKDWQNYSPTYDVIMTSSMNFLLHFFIGFV